MGPETKKRAPGAEKFKATNLWRPLAVMVLAASAAVYTENQNTSNQNQDSASKAHRVLTAREIKALSGSFSIPQLTQGPIKIDLQLITRATPIPIKSTPTEENLPVQALSAETQHPPGIVFNWLTSAGWPAELQGQAASVVFCESTNQPDKINPKGPWYGLFQLGEDWFHEFGVDYSLWSDPVINAQVAYKTYLRDLEVGNPPWYQWGCKP